MGIGVLAGLGVLALAGVAYLIFELRVAPDEKELWPAQSDPTQGIKTAAPPENGSIPEEQIEAAPSRMAGRRWSSLRRQYRKGG